MTQPPYPGPSGQPAPDDWRPADQGYPPPPQGQPPYPPVQGQPGYPQPGYPAAPGYPPAQGQPNYQQPNYQQPGYQQPEYPRPSYAPQGYSESYPGPIPPEGKPRGRGKLVAGAAAVIVLAGGGVATYVAFSDSSGQGGAGSPKQAVQQFVADVNHSDFLGLLDDLAPAEKRALANPVREQIKQLKRLNVLDAAADPNKISAVDVSATQLTFGDKTVTVNDHVQIVQITGGQLSVSADAARLPFTKSFLHTALAGVDLSRANTGTKTIDLADAIRQDHGRPIQIATEKVGDRWYPSLFYTIANYAVISSGSPAPNPSDRVPAVGASSSDEAVSEMITALARNDYRRAIELTSPDELAVLHDYGSVILQQAGPSHEAPFTVQDVQFNHKQITDGERLTLKSIELVSGGEHVKIAVDNGCFSATVNGQSQRLCVDQLLDSLSTTWGRGLDVTRAQRQAIADLVKGIGGIGIDVSQSGGSWYVNPVRSWFDISNSILDGLHGDDVTELVKLVVSMN